MKNIFLVVGLVTSLISSAQNSQGGSVPAALLTNDTTYWMISTLSNLRYVNTTPGAYYNTYKTGGGMIVKFKFRADGSYSFMMYVQANTYGIENESWTEIEGKLEFSQHEKGFSIFKTIPVKGTYRYNKNGQATSRAITTEEMAKNHTGVYIWDLWQNPDDTQNDYMLVLDLKQHPDIDLSNPKSIDPSWISKFHIPKKK